MIYATHRFFNGFSAQRICQLIRQLSHDLAHTIHSMRIAVLLQITLERKAASGQQLVLVVDPILPGQDNLVLVRWMKLINPQPDLAYGSSAVLVGTVFESIRGRVLIEIMHQRSRQRPAEIFRPYMVLGDMKRMPALLHHQTRLIQILSQVNRTNNDQSGADLIESGCLG